MPREEVEMTAKLEPIVFAVTPTFRVLAGGFMSVGWIREDTEGNWVARNFNTGLRPAQLRRFPTQDAAVRWLTESEMRVS
jgi:hypothetical protein